MGSWQQWAEAHSKLEVAHRTIVDCEPLCADASHSLVFDISEAAHLIDRVRRALVRQIAHARYEPDGEGATLHG